MFLFTTDREAEALRYQLHYSFILPGHSVQMRVHIRDDKRRLHQRINEMLSAAFADRHILSTRRQRNQTNAAQAYTHSSLYVGQKRAILNSVNALWTIKPYHRRK